MSQFIESDNTKSSYRTNLREVIMLFEDLQKKEPSPIFQSIINQLLDIKEMVVDNEIITDSFEIDERYTLGAIAVRYFDEGSDLRDKLSDLFYGAIHYSEYPEK